MRGRIKKTVCSLMRIVFRELSCFAKLRNDRSFFPFLARNRFLQLVWLPLSTCWKVLTWLLSHVSNVFQQSKALAPRYPTDTARCCFWNTSRSRSVIYQKKKRYFQKCAEGLSNPLFSSLHSGVTVTCWHRTQPEACNCVLDMIIMWEKLCARLQNYMVVVVLKA